MGKKKLSLILAIAALVISIVCPNNLVVIGMALSLILAIAALVLNKQAKKESSDGKNSVASTIISIIIIVISTLGFLALFMINNDKLRNSLICVNENLIKDCTKNNDNTSTCSYMGQDFKCSTDKLKESQFKK